MLVLIAAELAVTDTADHAIEALRSSGVEEVILLGRRGPAQAAFTNPEVRELADLVEADIIVDPSRWSSTRPAARLESDQADPTNKRNVEVLTKYASTPPSGKPKRIVLRFLASPVEILGEDRGHRAGDRAQRTRLADDGRSRRARPASARRSRRGS